jgi:hypothetical protein
MMVKTCHDLIMVLQEQKGTVRSLHEDELFKCGQSFRGQHDEMRANIDLALRHIEDAESRLERLVQQVKGWGNAIS